MRSSDSDISRTSIKRQQAANVLTWWMGTTRWWPPALNGDTNPSLCSAGRSPLSMKVKLGDAADPESLTMRDPLARTVVFGFRTPLSFIFPLLKVRVTLVVFV
jgi:hypothetical protein